ncbi:MAG: biotin/lipoyl-containing protein [Alphaproteobacteria bacterium]
MTIRKFKIKIDGREIEAEVEEIGVEEKINKEIKVKSKQHLSSQPVISSPSGKGIMSPMPGKIIKIKVSTGETVKKGDVVLILEAMKMEQEIKAPSDGAISQINVSEGDTVKKEQLLINFG